MGISNLVVHKCVQSIKTTSSTFSFKRFFTLFFFLLFFFSKNYAQSDGTWDAVKWQDGALWNDDGIINDLPNSPNRTGIVKFGSSSETESNLMFNSTYNSDVFMIPVSVFQKLPKTDLGQFLIYKVFVN